MCRSTARRGAANRPTWGDRWTAPHVKLEVCAVRSLQECTRLQHLRGSVLKVLILGSVAALLVCCTLRGAVSFGNTDRVKARLEAGEDPNAPSFMGVTPLELAVGSGELEIAQLLIEAGADVNTRLGPSQIFCEGFTVLMVAARRGNPEMVELLLRAGSDPNVETECGNTALSWAQYNLVRSQSEEVWSASSADYSRIIQLLKEAGAVR